MLTLTADTVKHLMKKSSSDVSEPREFAQLQTDIVGVFEKFQRHSAKNMLKLLDFTPKDTEDA